MENNQQQKKPFKLEITKESGFFVKVGEKSVFQKIEATDRTQWIEGKKYLISGEGDQLRTKLVREYFILSRDEQTTYLEVPDTGESLMEKLSIAIMEHQIRKMKHA